MINKIVNLELSYEVFPFEIRALDKNNALIRKLKLDYIVTKEGARAVMNEMDNELKKAKKEK